ncbi:ABC transporter ATP-binding protein [Novosphingobium sp. P6W]|uniref:ABC transporter ATP-binding protein n=1 Tax=Novosphingobium sp. P6W TaxID=1609758 RepID=UPI0005C31E39|nr:ABC transporter ATP-binding protein [Novosphingobium sp. P6W]AXB78537.1 ABC transporter ATP-binding protein [Novosphingobium sp. P6W]KIS30620.1 sulfonate ABC transporter ATP-binding protein [Novosphingobium sp. P6W]
MTDHRTLRGPASAKAPASTGAVRISGLSKRYAMAGKAMTVLDDINLSIRPGEFVSIVGPSGCGKSTLLRLIVGLDTDYDGEIRLDDTRVAGTGLERGLVFQDHRLFPWMTVAKNVEVALLNQKLPRDRREKVIAEHLALVGLSDFGDAYPHQLSGGMAQRAAIARALANEPKVLALDEPLGALDALTRVKVQAELQRIWMEAGTTMIMVTHDVDEALFLGDRVVVMSPRPGRIARIVDVDLPHPRDRASPLLHRLKDEILAELTREPRGDDGTLVNFPGRPRG